MLLDAIHREALSEVEHFLSNEVRGVRLDESAGQFLVLPQQKQRSLATAICFPLCKGLRAWEPNLQSDPTLPATP